MLLKQIPNILDVQSMTLKSYMKSRNILCLERALAELYEIRYGMSLLPSEVRRCANDAEVFRRSGVVPHYVLKGLELVRKYQIEVHTRSPTTT